MLTRDEYKFPGLAAAVKDRVAGGPHAGHFHAVFVDGTQFDVLAGYQAVPADVPVTTRSSDDHGTLTHARQLTSPAVFAGRSLGDQVRHSEFHCEGDEAAIPAARPVLKAA